VGLFSREPRKRPSSGPDAPDSGSDARKLALAYHQATKHHFHRYAAGPHELDWETQPDPFRRYAGAELLALERSVPGGEPWYELAFQPGTVAPRALDRASLSQLFFDSLALSAWKRAGEARWALRVNPSSGNLHPTEGTLLCGPVAGLCERPMVAHYAPREHALERRAEVPRELWEELARGLPPATVLVGLSSVHWREAWKYGERAFRYCQHDCGHAIAALAIAAAALGWRVRLLDELATGDLARLLGIAGSAGPEREEAEVLLAVGPPELDGAAWTPPRRETLAAWDALDWRGTPNELSPDHVEWPILDAVAQATRKPQTPPPPARASAARSSASAPVEPISLRAIVHQRRSAVALDGRSGMIADAFFQTLARTLPEVSPLVFAPLPWPVRVHLFLFVHRVQEVDPGLYLLLRDPSRERELRAAMDPQFEWARPAGCPRELALFRLKPGDARSLSRSVSCHQEIAADGCFSSGMLAELDRPLQREGAWAYRRLYWECGAIGQVLYLEAEALGLRGTGIGCFFDDAVHGAAGLRDLAWQSLYHFTLGRHVEDTRLTTEAAYGGEPIARGS
jgi:nitroreductase